MQKNIKVKKSTIAYGRINKSIHYELIIKLFRSVRNAQDIKTSGYKQGAMFMLCNSRAHEKKIITVFETGYFIIIVL